MVDLATQWRDRGIRRANDAHVRQNWLIWSDSLVAVAAATAAGGGGLALSKVPYVGAALGFISAALLATSTFVTRYVGAARDQKVAYRRAFRTAEIFIDVIAPEENGYSSDDVQKAFDELQVLFIDAETGDDSKAPA